LWSSICYRCLGRIETFEALGGIPHHSTWDTFKQRLEDLHDRKKIIFTPAYQVMGIRRYIETMDNLLDADSIVLRKLTRKICDAGNCGDIEKCTNAIKYLPNIGSFYSWQVICDLMESGILKGCDESSCDWVCLGPGAVLGLKRIFGEVKSSSAVGLCRLIRDKQNDFYQALGVNFLRFDSRNMSLKVLEHALCEFHKYKSIKVCNDKFNPMRIYRWKENGGKLRIDSQSCTVCLTALKGARELCDTCWRYFCERCSNSTGQQRQSWLCRDCRECCG